MRKVAESCGVSVSAVSQILNNREINFCSEETKERVRRVARELGYRPNFGYQILHGKSTRTVAVLIATPQMVEEDRIKNLTIQLLQRFNEKGYSAYCTCLSTDEATTMEMIRDLLFRGVEHIAFIGAPFGVDPILELLDSNSVSAVGLGSPFPRYISPAVHLGAISIFRYFLEKVGENFKLICRDIDRSPLNARIQALKRLYPEMSHEEIYRKFTFPCDDTAEGVEFFEGFYRSGRRSLRELLKRKPDIKGAVFMNDAAALGGASMLVENPGWTRLLIAGHNNDYSIRHYPYPISSSMMDYEKMVDLLAEYAISGEPCQIEVPPLVFIRPQAT
jgi:DNA-binding LacI/PurR family transcriptional regulator